MKFFIKKIINLKNLFCIKTKKKLVVFYSENQNYKNYFLPLIKKIILEKEFYVIYVTSDINDNHTIHKNIKNYFIGIGIFRLIFFTLLNCDFLITTLSNLNNNIKVSKKVKNIVYIPHSLCSTHKVYEKHAFKHYDIFFSTGNYQKQELEKTEKFYKYNKKKKVFNVGYVFFENFNNYKNKNKIIDSNNVIFAPSWQRNSRNLVNDYGNYIINTLLKKNFFVILRLHPEFVKRSSDKVNSIFKEFKNEKNFYLNTDLNDFSVFSKSDILITDNGGVSLEYVYLYRKPVLYINYSEKIQNKDYKNINLTTFEDSFKSNFCYQEEIKNFQNIEKKIDIIKNNFYKSKLDQALKFLNNQINLNGSPSDKIINILKKIDLKGI